MIKKRNKPLKEQYIYLKSRIEEIRKDRVVSLAFYKAAKESIKSYESKKD